MATKRKRVTRKEISSLSTDHLECRDSLHAWDTVGYYHTANDRSQVIRRQICHRCMGEKLTWLRKTRSGVVIVGHPRYYHDESFKLPGGGRPNKDYIRAELLSRMTIHSANELESTLANK